MAQPRFTVAEVASRVGVTLVGAGDTVVTGVASLSAIRPGSIVFAERPQDVPAALRSDAAAVVAAVAPPGTGRPAVLETPHVRRTFAEICRLFFGGYPAEAPGVHPAAVVHPSAELGAGVAIGPCVVIARGCRVGPRTVLRPGVVVDEDATIGADCYLFPGVVIGRSSVIGDRCTIHPNAVIGGEGFGFTDAADGGALKQVQFGRVVMGNDCEIGACTTIDRGTLDDTVIGDDVKMDNLVQIGHNCRVGSHVRIAAQAGFAGGAKVEEDCLIGGQVGVQNRVTIGRGTIAGGQSGITKDIPERSRLWGTPAHNHRDVLKEQVLVQRLPELLKRLEALEAQLAAIRGGEPER